MGDGAASSAQAGDRTSPVGRRHGILLIELYDFRRSLRELGAATSPVLFFSTRQYSCTKFSNPLLGLVGWAGVVEDDRVGDVVCLAVNGEERLVPWGGRWSSSWTETRRTRRLVPSR
jgi:hypothetical protein